MLSTIWDNSFLKDAISGIEDRLEGSDFSIRIFNAYDVTLGVNDENMEEKIYSLVNPLDYDGAFVACNTTGNKAGILRTLERLRKAGVPVVNLGSRVDGDAFVNVDYHRAIYRITEHLIKEHGCRRINYIGGTKTTQGSKMRLKGFLDCLSDNGIEAEKERMIQLNYIYEDGIEAYRIFKRKGVHLADAVVCANDNMALGYCDAASEDGFYCPKDFIITGFDGIVEAREYDPSITTVDPNWVNMGYIGADVLLKLIDRQNVEPENYSSERILYNSSCGCTNDLSDSRMEALAKLRRNQKNKQIDSNLRFFFQNVFGADNAEELLQRFVFFDNSVEIPEYAICVNSGIFDGVDYEPGNGYDDEMTLMYRGGIERFHLDSGVIPEQMKKYFKTDTLMLSPLYFSDLTFGYIIMQYTDKMLDFTRNGVFFSYISNALERLRLKMIIDKNNSDDKT